MSAPEYTPGPWECSFRGFSDDYCIRIQTAGNRSLVAYIDQARNAEANAERIVACVNACAGIADPSAVPEMLAALKAAEVELVMAGKPGSEQVIRIVMAAIARAEGLGE